jgi:hypothetical protein
VSLHKQQNNKEKPGKKMKQMNWLAGSMVLALGIGVAVAAQVRPNSGSRNVSSDEQKQQLLPDDTGGKSGAAGGKGGSGGKGGQNGGQGGAGGKGGQGGAGGNGGGAGGKGGGK